MFGPIQEGRTETIVFVWDDTVVVNQRKEKERIARKDFQRDFLSLWLIERAVAEDLKDGLLGIGEASRIQHCHEEKYEVTSTR